MLYRFGGRPLLDSPALFLEFAHTPPTPEGCIGFAEKHGWLFSLDNDTLHYWGRLGRHRSGTGEPYMAESESYDLWIDLVNKFHDAAVLYLACLSGDAEALKERIIWKEDGATHIQFDATGTKVAERHRLLPLSEAEYGVRRGDDLGMARLLALQQLSSVMATFGAQRTELTSGNEGEMKLNLVPQNLIGAMALQFQAAMAEGKSFRRCPMCSGWYEMPKDGRSIGREFCSPKCRVKAHRKAADVRQMTAEGVPFPEIGRKLRIEESTVQWLLGRDAESKQQKEDET